jgi:hypothetical protein
MGARLVSFSGKRNPMTCRDIESLILAERDGAPNPAQRAVLSDHVAACPACQQFRARLGAALDAYRTGIDAAPVPNADQAWHDVKSRLHDRRPQPRERRRLAPVIWFGTPLAAAAALAVAFFVGGSPFVQRTPVSEVPPALTVAETPPPPPPPPPAPPQFRNPPAHDPSIIAGADFVETADPNASTIVYVDEESGWLVVWATGTTLPTSG